MQVLRRKYQCYLESRREKVSEGVNTVPELILKKKYRVFQNTAALSTLLYTPGVKGRPRNKQIYSGCFEVTTF
jgi:hypothetical protein